MGDVGKETLGAVRHEVLHRALGQVRPLVGQASAPERTERLVCVPWAQEGEAFARSPCRLARSIAAPRRRGAILVRNSSAPAHSRRGSRTGTGQSCARRPAVAARFPRRALAAASTRARRPLSPRRGLRRGRARVRRRNGEPPARLGNAATVDGRPHTTGPARGCGSDRTGRSRRSKAFRWGSPTLPHAYTRRVTNSAPPGSASMTSRRKKARQLRGFLAFWLSPTRRRGLEPPPDYPGPGPQPGEPGAIWVQIVPPRGPSGHVGRSGCCHGCCQRRRPVGGSRAL
jgi:hypothetical protein